MEVMVSKDYIDVYEGLTYVTGYRKSTVCKYAGKKRMSTDEYKMVVVKMVREGIGI